MIKCFGNGLHIFVFGNKFGVDAEEKYWRYVLSVLVGSVMENKHWSISLKVPMKWNCFSHICEIYHLKYTIPKIPKFEMFGSKIDGFISPQSFCPQKWLRKWVRDKSKISHVSSLRCQKIVYTLKLYCKQDILRPSLKLVTSQTSSKPEKEEDNVQVIFSQIEHYRTNL